MIENSLKLNKLKKYHNLYVSHEILHSQPKLKEGTSLSLYLRQKSIKIGENMTRESVLP